MHSRDYVYNQNQNISAFYRRALLAKEIIVVEKPTSCLAVICSLVASWWSSFTAATGLSDRILLQTCHTRDFAFVRARNAQKASWVQRSKWSPTANDPQTIGPQMIPNHIWSRCGRQMILPEKGNGMEFVPRVEVLIFNFNRNKSWLTIFYMDIILRINNSSNYRKSSAEYLVIGFVYV